MSNIFPEQLSPDFTNTYSNKNICSNRLFYRLTLRLILKEISLGHLHNQPIKT